MKKYLIAAGAAVPVILIAFLIINFTVTDKKEYRHHPEKVSYHQNKSVEAEEGGHSCCSSGEETEEISENSIYQLDSKWSDQSGKRFSLSQLKGNPVVLTMFFASCTYACPILVNDMKKIEGEIPDKELDSYKFILVSIDPERDTPKKLAKFAEEKSLDTKRWTLLTGTRDEIMELAALIGFKYKKNDNGDFSHSNLITFLNKEGEIIHQQIGLNQDPSGSTKILLAQK